MLRSRPMRPTCRTSDSPTTSRSNGSARYSRPATFTSCCCSRVLAMSAFRRRRTPASPPVARSSHRSTLTPRFLGCSQVRVPGSASPRAISTASSAALRGLIDDVSRGAVMGQCRPALGRRARLPVGRRRGIRRLLRAIAHVHDDA